MNAGRSPLSIACTLYIGQRVLAPWIALSAMDGQNGAAAMEPIPPPVVEIDLSALDDFLLSGDAPEDSMLLPDLDGFLTGIAVGPEPIMPSEWLPCIWGGEEPEFASAGQANLILGTILGRYNEIVEHLDAGPDSFDPVFEQAVEGNLIVTDWAAGFVEAAMLRARTWEALIRDQEMAAVFWPLLLLGAEDDEYPPFGAPPVPAESMDELNANADAIITECVFRIRAFWRQHGSIPAPKSKPKRRRPDTRQRRGHHRAG
jgi:uncharacterized protein